jgi:hypothetical protein
MQESFDNNYRSGNTCSPYCRTFVTLLGAHLRPGAFRMSRTFRTLALSAALLATTATAFACAPGGTNPPPKGGQVMSTSVSLILSFLGL